MTFILALDLDGVTGDYEGAFRHHVAAELDVDPSTLPSPTTWSYAEAGWGIESEDHYLELHGKAVQRGLFRMMKPMPGASESLWRLSDAGVYTRVVTHRLFIKGLHEVSAGDTLKWLDTENIPYRDICFVGNKPQVSADVYIDDAPHNVASLRAAGGYVIVFDQPYNRHLDGPRARNWAEAEELILARKAEVEADLDEPAA